MPTYRIDRPGMDLPRVVSANSPAEALSHVVKDEIKVKRLDVDEAFELAQQGVTLERAGEAPVQEPFLHEEPPVRVASGGEQGEGTQPVRVIDEGEDADSDLEPAPDLAAEREAAERMAD